MYRHHDYRVSALYTGPVPVYSWKHLTDGLYSLSDCGTQDPTFNQSTSNSCIHTNGIVSFGVFFLIII